MAVSGWRSASVGSAAAKASLSAMRLADRGQMSVELMVVFPVAIALALIVINGLHFMGLCASFDRIARNAIRVEACAPGYGVDEATTLASIETLLRESFAAENVECAVGVRQGFLGQRTYTATLDCAPTLFGLGLRDEVFGVALPRLHHEVTLTVDPYHPGIVW